MGRMEKRMSAVVLSVLLLALGGMLLQDLLSGDDSHIYHITILMDGSEEAYWQNFRLGVDRAARDRNADVRYRTRYEGEAGTAQAKALQSAWESGNDGVILFPVDQPLLEKTLEEAPAGLAITVVGADLENSRVDCTISADPVEMGRTLADAIAQDSITDVLLCLPAQETAAIALRRQGLTQRLTELGIRWSTATATPSDLPALSAGQAVAALEPTLAEALCQAAIQPGSVYGIGSSDLLFHHLEEGTVAALVVQSDYEVGYLSLLSLLDALEGTPPQDQLLSCYTVTAENMFSDPLDQILFPST